jgi:hypothetical protein
MTEPRAQEGIDHLQRAAVELIAAARAFLDVAEDVVTDRDRFTDAAGTVSDLVGSVMAAVRTGWSPDDSGDDGEPTAPPPPTAPWASILEPEGHDRVGDDCDRDRDQGNGQRVRRRAGLEIVADPTPDEPRPAISETSDRDPGRADPQNERPRATKARVRRIAVD